MNWIFRLVFCLFPFASQGAQIDPNLCELAAVMRVEHDGTLPSLVQEVQKKWLRPAGSELWEVQDLSAENKARVLEIAGRMGYFEEKRPSKKEYDYCVLLGGTVGRMQQRMEYVVGLWEDGVRFKQCVFLSGHRPLDPAVEQATKDYNTESEAIHYLWDNMPMPESMRALPVTFVDVPMIKEENGMRRPSRTDTFTAWLGLNPLPGSCLFICNQPYCEYQQAVAQACLPVDFESETVGFKANLDKLNGSVVLDTIARTLYFKSKN